MTPYWHFRLPILARLQGGNYLECIEASLMDVNVVLLVMLLTLFYLELCEKGIEINSCFTCYRAAAKAKQFKVEPFLFYGFFLLNELLL